MCRSGITQCLRPVNAGRLSLPFMTLLGKMAGLNASRKGRTWALTCTSIASPASAAT